MFCDTGFITIIILFFFFPSRYLPVSRFIWQFYHLLPLSWFQVLCSWNILVEIYYWLFRWLWLVGWKTQNKAVTNINKVVTYKSPLCTHLGLSTLCSKPRPQLWLPVLRGVPPFMGVLAGQGYPVLERSGQIFFLCVCDFYISLPCQVLPGFMLHGALSCKIRALLS